MGIIKRGILGGFSNKVANVVGTSWKGRAVIKSLPLSVANPRTTPQVNQRTKFGEASKFFSEILGTWVKPLWDRFSGDISGYNAIMKENVESFSTLGVPVWADLVLSKGRMETPTTSGLTADASTDVIGATIAIPADATWGQANEVLFYMLVNETTGKIIFVDQTTVNPEDDFVMSASDSDMVTGNVLRLYTALKRADGTQVSNTSSVTTVVVA